MIAFTLCSNNYLAQAKTFGDSLKKHNPNCKFIIGLVDQLNSNIDYNLFPDTEIIPLGEIGLENFDELWKRFNIVEFNTCIKASFFKFLFKKYTEEEKIVFFDPDIIVYHSLAAIEADLITNEILIVPHICSAINPDGFMPGENLFLNYGLYNLGFIALTRNTTVPDGFLDWWEYRTLNFGFDNVSNGLFVDQLWINFVPIFFKKVKIIFEKGYNVAPWNLHERTVVKQEQGNFLMNDMSPLVFYHFSSYRHTNPDQMSKHYNRYNFNTHPELKELYAGYLKQLIKNGIEEFSTVPCIYIVLKEQYEMEKQKALPSKPKPGITKQIIKGITPPVIVKLARDIFTKPIQPQTAASK